MNMSIFPRSLVVVVSQSNRMQIVISIVECIVVSSYRCRIAIVITALLNCWDSDDVASTKDPQFFRGFQIFCGSQSSTLRWSGASTRGGEVDASCAQFGSGEGKEFHPQEGDFPRYMGHKIVSSCHQMRFLGSKFTQNALAAGAPPRTSLGELKRSQAPSRFKGAALRQGKGREGERERRGK